MTPMVYVLHCSGLYGTERMAMETLEGFKSQYHPIILCPPGPLVNEAEKRGIRVVQFSGVLSLSMALFKLLKRYSSMVLMSTAISHALVFAPLNMVLRRKIAHLHLVHGGAGDQLSYGRKKYLNHFNLVQVGVSLFVKGKLLQYGVKESKIRVVGNFLSRQTRDGIRKKAPFKTGPLKRGLVVSRIIPGKRVDLLFEAVEKYPSLNHCVFTIFGKGGMQKRLRARAEKNNLNISLPGFAEDLNNQVAQFDFLVHLCGDEPFGLVILEAMAARIPVLVPDEGGSSEIVEHGITGLKFKANDPNSLAQEIDHLRHMPPEQLNALTSSAEKRLLERFSCEARVLEYARIIDENGRIQ